MHGGSVFIAALGLLVVLYCMFAWWSDVVFESKDGDHTPVVQIGLRYGVILGLELDMRKQGLYNDR